MKKALMQRVWPICGVLAAMVFVGGCLPDAQGPTPVVKPKPATTFKPQEVADALHAVIAADREVYARTVLQRMTDAGIVRAAEDWGKTNALPTPDHMTRMASQLIQSKGAEFHYVLRSLRPLSPVNSPHTDTERAGLEFVAAQPGKAFYQEESLGGRAYFTAVYADVALVRACVDCHNTHPRASKKDFKTGDVLGGVVVRVPLEF